MKRTYTLFSGTLLIVALAGCRNTLNSVSDTAEGAVRGTGKIIQGVGEGIDHIGKGIKEDIDSDDKAKDADNNSEDN